MQGDMDISVDQATAAALVPAAASLLVVFVAGARGASAHLFHVDRSAAFAELAASQPLPRRVKIPSIHVNARLVRLGL